MSTLEREPDPFDVLASIRGRGVRLWVEHGNLRFQAAKGALRENDLTQLRSCKQQIVALLTGDALLRRPIPKRATGESIPLTPIQRLAWNSTHADRVAHPRAYAFATRITGPLGIAALGQAMRLVMARHDILRTILVCRDGVPTQCIGEAKEEPWAIAELATIGDLQAFVEEQVTFSAGPLFEARLLRMAREDHILVVALDGSITDCTSNDILCGEIWRTYARLARNEAHVSHPDPLQYADYASWLQALEPVWMDVHAAHWRAHLTDARPMRLAGREPSTGAAAGREVARPVRLDDQTFGQLLTFARETSTLPALVVLAAYVAVLSRWNRANDLIVMVINHGRDRPELENMVGCLVNQLFLRFTVHGQQTFRELLSDVGKEMDRAIAHVDFNRVHTLVPATSADFSFNWITSREIEVLPSDEELHDLGISLRPYEVAARSAALPAVGVVFRHGANVTGTLKYRSDACEVDRAEDLEELLVQTLREILRQPSQRIGDVLP